MLIFDNKKKNVGIRIQVHSIFVIKFIYEIFIKKK